MAFSGTFHVDSLQALNPQSNVQPILINWSNFSPNFTNNCFGVEMQKPDGTSPFGMYQWSTCNGNSFFDKLDFSGAGIATTPGPYIIKLFDRDYNVWTSQVFDSSEIQYVDQFNASISIGTISVPTTPVQVNSSIAASANITDARSVGVSTAVWDWGDGNTSAGTVTDNNGAGSVSGIHAYTTPGIYTLTLTVTDNNGEVATNQYQYLVVYDSSTGFVTGSGSFDTPAGSNPANTDFTGKTHFGFNAKYKKDGSLDGTTKMDWKPKETDIDLDSLSYQWLVINGNKAQFKGTGKIMGQGSYTFLITVIDGGTTNPDKLRIKITNNADNSIVYDNQMGAPDSADPTMTIAKGQIKIHN